MGFCLLFLSELSKFVTGNDLHGRTDRIFIFLCKTMSLTSKARAVTGLSVFLTPSPGQNGSKALLS